MPRPAPHTDLSTIGTFQTPYDPPPGTVVVRVLHDGIVTMRMLPSAGELAIGRAAECDEPSEIVPIDPSCKALSHEAGETEALQLLCPPLVHEDLFVDARELILAGVLLDRLL